MYDIFRSFLSLSLSLSLCPLCLSIYSSVCLTVPLSFSLLRRFPDMIYERINLVERLPVNSRGSTIHSIAADSPLLSLSLGHSFLIEQHPSDVITVNKRLCRR